MNKRIARLNKAAFKHHNDSKATIKPVTGEEFEAEIIIDRGMESLTSEGDVRSNETHIQILHLDHPVSKWPGTVITLIDTNDSYRCDRKESDDGYVVRLAVTKV